MPVPSTIDDLNTTAGLNSPLGSESPNILDNVMRAHGAFIAQLRDGSADAVKLTGDQTIAGAKTFSSPIVGALSGNASTATSATTATNCTRSVLVGGLATGGGALTADRTVTVTAASQAQAEAGTDNATAMTPLRTKQAIDALANPLPDIAAASVGAVGTLAMLQEIVNAGINRMPGDTLPGVELTYSNANGNASGTSPSGTWRLLGYSSGSPSNIARTSLWVRIS